MAIDESLARDTSSLVLPHKKFYPIRIDIGHWQLRHYLSSPEPHILYYAAKERIYSFNTKSQVRNYICPLNFPARCTAAAYGYIVVGGGGNGRFAIIQLDDHTAAVDDALPVGLPHPASARQSSPGPDTVTIKYETLGNEIVNSVSIHKLHSEEPGTRDDIVAVLTNNDKSVRVYSLTQGKETCALHLRFSANHATISPQGNMLVAVGDYQEAYFFERVTLPPTETKNGHLVSYASSRSTWITFDVVPLHVKSPALLAGYFTTAWSADGRLCAVGSECGYITVFDMECLMEVDDGEDAIVAIIPSTRPDAQPSPGAPGAVRSMMFSPPPWDLLVWAEDQGRVCVADLRTGLRVKQVLDLDQYEVGLDKVLLNTTTSSVGLDAPISSRYGDTDTSRSHMNRSPGHWLRDFTLDRHDVDQGRRDFQRLANALTGDPEIYLSLNAEERSLLDSLTEGRITNRVNTYPSRNTHYRSAEGSDERRVSPTPSALSRYAVSEFPALSRTRADRHVGLNVGGIERQESQSVNSIHEALRNRRPRTSDLRFSGRRDANPVDPVNATISVVQYPPASGHHSGDANSGNGASPHWTPPHLRPIQSRSINLTTVHPSAPEPASSNSSSTSSPPDTFAPTSSATFTTLINSAAQNALAPLTPLSPNAPSDLSTNAALASFAAHQSRRRPRAPQSREAGQRPRSERIQYRDSPLGRYQQSLLNSRRHMTGHPDPNCGPQTAGLAMSSDGSTLWAAAECGIWEFKLDLKRRRAWPAEEPM